MKSLFVNSINQVKTIDLEMYTNTPKVLIEESTQEKYYNYKYTPYNQEEVSVLIPLYYIYAKTPEELNAIMDLQIKTTYADMDNVKKIVIVYDKNIVELSDNTIGLKIGICCL